MCDAQNYFLALYMYLIILYDFELSKVAPEVEDDCWPINTGAVKGRDVPYT